MTNARYTKTLHAISREAAYQTGLRRFFTNTPCRNGHLSERYVSNGVCVSCINAKFKYRRSGISHDLMPFLSARLWVVRDFTPEQTLALDCYLQGCIAEFIKHAGKLTNELSDAIQMHIEKMS